MGKVYGKNTSGNTQLIIDGDAIDQRLSTLEANWDSISHYSTTETPTGKTWIDGKPIYRKVIVTSGFTGNAANNIAHGISSIGDVVDFRFYLRNPTGKLILPVPRIGYTGSDSNESFSNYAYISKTNIVFTCGSSSSYSSGYAIIEYTKA